MKTMIKYLLAFAITATSFIAQATDEPPRTNTKSPEYIFHDIQYWSKKQASISSFRGKWLVLDGWSLGCGTCVKGFPRMNELNRQLKDKATFMLVGREHPYIRGWYEKYRQAHQLELPVVFDSGFFKLFDVRSVPFIVIIDPEGIIRAITSDRMEKDKLEQLFATGKNPFNRKSESESVYPFDDKKPFLINGNGGRDDRFLFRSVISRWNGEQEYMLTEFGKLTDWSRHLKNGIQYMGVYLSYLYSVGYIGTTTYRPWDTALYNHYVPDPVIEVKDPGVFQGDIDNNKNVFCYSLIVPDSLATADYLRKKMIRDLDNFFNFRSSMEERDVPVWEVVSTKNLNHLRTKGGPEKYFRGLSDDREMIYQNVPMSYVIAGVQGHHQEQPPFIDRTGVDYNIDIRLDCIPDDFASVKKALAKEGILLVKSTKKMKVIVIRDAE